MVITFLQARKQKKPIAAANNVECKKNIFLAKIANVAGRNKKSEELAGMGTNEGYTERHPGGPAEHVHEII